MKQTKHSRKSEAQNLCLTDVHHSREHMHSNDYTPKIKLYNYNNFAYATVFNSINFTLYLNENPLNYLLSQSVFQVICKRLVSKRVMLLHLLCQTHHSPCC